MKSDSKIGVFFLGRGPIAERCFPLCKENTTIAIKGVCSNERFKERFLKDTSVPFVSNERRNEDAIVDIIKDNKIDYLISVQHPWIFSKDLLDRVGSRAFNLHNAKLPEYQGFNSISHAILNGDTTYTTTIHWVIPAVDSGPIAYEETVDIDCYDTAKTLYDKAVDMAVKNFGKLVDSLADHRAIPRRELCGERRFYKKKEISSLKKIQNILDHNEVKRKTRAFYFPNFEPAYFVVGEEKYFVIPASNKKC